MELILEHHVCAGPSEKIHIAFGGKEHVVFQGFKAADLTSALALLEHLTADS
jgi:hypothetical protein